MLMLRNCLRGINFSQTLPGNKRIIGTTKSLIIGQYQHHRNYSKKINPTSEEDIDFESEPELQMEGDFPEFEKMKEQLEKDFAKDPESQKGIFDSFDKDRKEYGVPEVDPANYENKTYKTWKKDNTDKSAEKAKNIVKYKAQYRDARGEANIPVYLRGDKVCVMLANKFQYTGDDFHSLNPPPGYDKIIIETYTLYQHNEEGHLTQFSLSFQLPFKFIINQKVQEIPMDIDIQVDHSILPAQLHRVSVEIDDIKYESKVTDSMNDSLLHLLSLLPQYVTFQSCWTCGWSHYNPFSRSAFGGLACFLGKEEMLNKNSIRGIYHIWEKMERDVPENYLCDKYVVRTVKLKMPGHDELLESKHTFDFESK